MQVPAKQFEDVWTSAASQVDNAVRNGHGISIPGLGTVKVVKDIESGQPVSKPTFQLSPAFAQANACRPGTASRGNAAGIVKDFNAVKAAAQHDSSPSTQTEGLKKFLQQLGDAAAAGHRVRSAAMQLHSDSHSRHSLCVATLHSCDFAHICVRSVSDNVSTY